MSGSAVWRAAEEGLWHRHLLDAALARSESANLGDVQANAGRVSLPGMPAGPPTAFLIEYRNGTHGNGPIVEWPFAGFRIRRRHRQRLATSGLPVPSAAAPGARHFDGQAAAIEQLISTGRSPQPLQRTLLTTGMLAGADG